MEEVEEGRRTRRREDIKRRDKREGKGRRREGGG